MFGVIKSSQPILIKSVIGQPRKKQSREANSQMVMVNMMRGRKKQTTPGKNVLRNAPISVTFFLVWFRGCFLISSSTSSFFKRIWETHLCWMPCDFVEITLQTVLGERTLLTSIMSSRWLHMATNRSKNSLLPPASISACMVPLRLKVLRQRMMRAR